MFNRRIAELELLPTLPLSQQRDMARKHIKENGRLERKTPQEIQQDLIRFDRDWRRSVGQKLV